MAVETLSGEFASAVGPLHGLFGNTKTWFGRYNWSTTVVEDGDIRKALKLPGHILVVGGELWAGDLDSGSETLDIDVGWASNGGGAATYSMSLPNGATYTFTNAAENASATGFINSGVLTGDGVTDLFASGINYRPVPLITGPLYFSHETQVQFEVNAPSATPAAAQMWLFLRYIGL